MDISPMASMPIWKILLIQTLMLPSGFLFSFFNGGLNHVLAGTLVITLFASLSALFGMYIKQYAAAASFGYTLVILSFCSSAVLARSGYGFLSVNLLIFGFLLSLATFLLISVCLPDKWDAPFLSL